MIDNRRLCLKKLRMLLKSSAETECKTMDCSFEETIVNQFRNKGDKLKKIKEKPDL